MFRTLAVVSVLIGAAFGVTAHAATAEELMLQAKAAYDQREFNTAGIVKAQESADLYGQAAKLATDARVRATAQVGQSEAIYFVGFANTDNKVKIEKHLAGIDSADQVVKLWIKDVTALSSADIATLKKLPPEDIELLGHALFQRGANLGQWGQANGITESLGRWPELRSTMETIVNLGVASIHEYGAYRALGRGFFKVPALFGGSNKKSEKYLTAAYTPTLVPGTKFSTNGYTNIYLAELYKDISKESEGKAILKAFVAADARAINPPALPEFVQAQKEAAEILKAW